MKQENFLSIVIKTVGGQLVALRTEVVCIGRVREPGG